MAFAFLTSQDVARILGVTSKTVSRWVREGRLPFHHRTLGGNARFSKEAIEKIAAEQEPV